MVNSQKKICVVTTVSITLKTFLFDQLEYLADHGFDITVVCHPDEELATQLANSKLKYIPITMKRGIDPIGFFKSIFQLYKLFSKHKFDMVQYATPNAAFYSSIAAKSARINVRLYSQWGIRYVGFKGIKRGLFKQIEKLVCLLSTHVQPDSFGNLDFSVEEKLYPRSKGSVIWNGSANGVNLNKFNAKHKEKWSIEIRNKHSINNDEFVVGYVGRMVRDKGINELIAAFKELCQRFNNLKLLLVGPDDGENELDPELGAWVNSTNQIVFSGYTNEVEKYLAAMDVFVLPSYREGFGSVVIEAEAMKVPVIVTDIPGPRDAIIKDVTGILVPINDAIAIHTAILNLIIDKTMQAKLSQSSLKFISDKFDQKEFYKEKLDSLSNILTRKEVD